ncbi:uncharacterized protein LY79DRAFT_554374 [Colletotrichum navitas]|uniref:Uncharacterized protein n=1 Tax=Colletotrichum navitas TaxID=681940 RepID=A0AAD8PZU9_9PEZI|nr:uncharacterized protein LY79DRAFT_554374 [Colletotrichum navitas]KAK1590619.1 hypothetical protein LY79DRAFT_554374 [Colletotrichum navitas]
MACAAARERVQHRPTRDPAGQTQSLIPSTCHHPSCAIVRPIPSVSSSYLREFRNLAPSETRPSL